MGIYEYVGHAITLKILTGDTLKVINRVNICSAELPLEYNLSPDPIYVESKHIIKSKADNLIFPDNTNLNQSTTNTHAMPLIEPSDLVGCFSWIISYKKDLKHFRNEDRRKFEK